jgi:hypothetical protein
MNLLQIRNEAWFVAGDLAKADQDRQWSTFEMNQYINRVYRTIARETKCIKDSITPAICLVPANVVIYTTYVAGTQDYIWANSTTSWLYHLDVAPYIYTLNPLIIDVEEVKWTTKQWKLTKVSVTKWQTNPWWEQVIGMPTEYATDLSNNTIVLNFRATDSDTLRLVVRRMPLVDLIADADIPEIRTHYHDFFKNGVLAQMYMKQSEAYDHNKAIDYETRFKQDLNEIKRSESLLNEMLRPNYSTLAFR